MVNFDPWYRANRCIIVITLATVVLHVDMSCGDLAAHYPNTQGFMQYLPMPTPDRLTGILLESALCKQGTSRCLLRGPGHLPPSRRTGLSQRCTYKTQRHNWLAQRQRSSLLQQKCTEHCHSLSGPAEVPMSTIPTCRLILKGLSISLLSCVNRDTPANLLGQIISSADETETQ